VTTKVPASEIDQLATAIDPDFTLSLQRPQAFAFALRPYQLNLVAEIERFYRNGVSRRRAPIGVRRRKDRDPRPRSRIGRAPRRAYSHLHRIELSSLPARRFPRDHCMDARLPPTAPALARRGSAVAAVRWLRRPQSASGARVLGMWRRSSNSAGARGD